MDEKLLAGAGSAFAGLMFLWAVFQQHLSFFHIDFYLRKYSQRLVAFVYPYLQITFAEVTGGDYMMRDEAYNEVESYLADSSSQRATKLKAQLDQNSRSVTLSMAEFEEVTDEFHGATLWWSSYKVFRRSQGFSFYPADDEKRFYTLTFHRRHRETVVDAYLPYVIRRGREARVRRRERRLHTNNPSSDWNGFRSSAWSHIKFEHPATFDTLALNPTKKEEVVADLIAFKNAKDYYSKIGKPWKRGYLLHGPPGTGKSTMIAAIANFLEYDIYDLELTCVKNNSELRKLFIETTNKSIIVIEDIDCSLDLSGRRKPPEKKKKKKDDEDDDEKAKKMLINKGEKEESKVTLSGLLNFIDGLWSACGGERLVIFTTNYVEKLDPALIRRGRMDMHIEMSYCGFEAFKVLARNYLRLDWHPLFPDIRRLLEEVQITPADVAENLMVKSTNENAGTFCLKSLIQDLEKAKEKAISKAVVNSDSTKKIVEEEEEEEDRDDKEEEKKDEEEIES